MTRQLADRRRLATSALAAVAAGFAVFPVLPGRKQPALPRWEQKASRDSATVLSWYRHRACNIGIATGPSGLVVIDLDDGPGEAPPQWAGARNGHDVLVRLAEQAGAQLPDTYTVRTPTGGWHLYFQTPPESHSRNTAGRLGWRVDTRACGVVAAVGVSSRASVLIEALRTAMPRARSAPACASFPRAADPAGATDGGRRR